MHGSGEPCHRVQGSVFRDHVREEVHDPLGTRRDREGRGVDLLERVRQFLVVDGDDGLPSAEA